MFRLFPIKEASDESLVQQMCRGNEKAFEQLYGRYFDKLAWYAYSYLQDMAKAEDAVQDVFMKIIQKPEHFDTRQKFSTWIYAITGNACKNILRNEQNRMRILQQVAPRYTDTVQAHTDTDARQLEAKLQSIVDTLSEKERLIYTLRIEQAMSIARVAEITGMPEGSVKSGLYYLLKKFDQQLKDYKYEY